MHTIEVDFDVFKALTGMRETEAVTYNDVVRRLLKLETKPRAQEPSGPSPDDWVIKGVRFAVGDEFRGRHNGRVHTGRVENGGLVVNGKKYDSPSAAAAAITGYAVNGWIFWEFRKPGGDWRLMSGARK